MKTICEYLEKFCAWSYDNGFFYFSGRDIYCILLGISLSVIIIALVAVFIREAGDES